MLESQHKVPVNIHQLVMKLNLRTYCLCLIVLSDCSNENMSLCKKKSILAVVLAYLGTFNSLQMDWASVLAGRKKNRDDMCFKKCF